MNARLPLLTAIFLLLVSTTYGQCPEAIYAGPINDSCNEWEFEIGDFEEGAQVLWDFGDGLGTVSGHYAQHTYSANGTYEVCGHYVSPLCPDSAIYCETIVVACEDEPCGLEVLAEIDGDTLILVPFAFPDNATIWWSVNGNDIGPSDSFSFALNQPGTYQICAFYETPECPFGTQWCDIWTVEGEEDCNLEMDVELDGDTLLFYPEGYPDGAVISWFVNDNFEGSGDFFSISIADPGTYTVCAGYETPECPQGVFWCETWVIEEGDDCPTTDDFFAGSDGDDCFDWVFEIGTFVEGEQVIWDFGDGTSELGGHFIEHEYEEEGEYTVCGYYMSPLCPDTVELCQTILVECEDESCELDVDVELDGDTLLFYPEDYPDGAVISWFVNDNFEGSGDFFSISIADPGTYTICAGYETPECPQGVFWCETWVIEEGDDCPTTDDFFAGSDGDDCFDWVFEIGTFVEGEQVIWDFGDGTSELGGHFIEHEYEEEGEYTVCGYYTSPLCPDTVELCQTILVECEDESCELDVDVELDGDTLLFYPEDYPDGVVISWFVNDNFEGSGDFFSISIADPGTYTVCAGYETPECPQGVFWCETWEIEACSDLTMVFTFDGAADLAEVEWELEGIDADWSDEGELPNPSDSVAIAAAVCIPDGCYEFSISAESTINLEMIDVALESDGMADIIWLDGDDDDEIEGILSVNADCETLVGITESALVGAVLFPVPSSGMLNVNVPSTELVQLRIFSTTGQLVAQAAFRQNTQLDLSGLPTGMYMIQLQLNNELKAFSFPLLNR